MKNLFKLIAFVAIVLVASAAIIKFVQRTTWREAVGIMEEFWIECREKCRCCKSAPEEPEA
jgi:hypothetical protein